MACAVQAGVEQQVLGQTPQPSAGAVLPTVAFALEQSRALELREHPVHGRLGQAGLVGQALQGEELVAGGDDLEQREQP